MKVLRRLFSVIIILTISANLSVTSYAASIKTAQDALNDTAKYVYTTVKSPKFGSIGGEWAVFGLARSGYAVPEKYYQDYYAAAEKYVKDCKGILSTTKYSEYSRLVLALSAIGMDARSVSGYDLTKPLGDYDKTIRQGVNGAAFALLALDSSDYPMPKNEGAAVQATRQMYVDNLLESQLTDGGWNLYGADGNDYAADLDVTSMAIQALAKYRSQPAVEKAVDKALGFLSGRQNPDGGFGTTSETSSQMVIVLCELGIPLDDERFVKNGNTILDRLLTFYREGKGFTHTSGAVSTNQMATEQGLVALAAVVRAANDKNNLYDISDPLQIKAGSGRQLGSGLENKIPEVKTVPVTNQGVTFADISGVSAHKNRIAVEKLAERGIITGKTSDRFYPDDKMTRAEFSTIIVRALGLPVAASDAFSDVKTDMWHSRYVGAAYRYGVVNGLGGGIFNPEGLITKQEAAVMIARAAKLCGMETEMKTSAVRDILAQFGDYIKSADWARSGLAFCYGAGLLDTSDLEIEPERKILRCEVAEMVYRLLGASNLF